MVLGSNRAWIGVKQPPCVTKLDRDRVRAYADATGDSNSIYHGAAVHAPPMAAVIGSIPDSVFALLNQEEFIRDRSRLAKLLHGEENIRWFCPIRNDDELHMVSTVVDIEDKGVGEIMVIETIIHNQRGEHLTTHLTSLMIRETKAPRDRVRSRRQSKPDPALYAEPSGLPIVSEWRIDDDQPRRYAEASGDNNPIHLHDEAAQMAGFKGRVLHGLCTMAFVQRVVIDEVAARDPCRLRRLRVRFSRPVYPGDVLTCQLTPVGIPGHYRVVVKNQNDALVLKDGVAEIGSE